MTHPSTLSPTNAGQRLLQAAGGDRALLRAALQEFQQLGLSVPVRFVVRYIRLNRRRWREFGDLHPLEEIGLAVLTEHWIRA